MRSLPSVVPGLASDIAPGLAPFAPAFFFDLLPTFEQLVYPFNPVICPDDLYHAIHTIDSSVEDRALLFAFAAATLFLAAEPSDAMSSPAPSVADWQQRGAAADLQHRQILTEDGTANPDDKGPSWAIGTLLLVYSFVCDAMVGPLCYAIDAEIPSTRLKVKSVVLARNVSNIAGFLNNSLMPRMLGVNSWNWGAKTALFWAGFCVLILVWAFSRLPEAKDRTYGKLDVLFQRGVNARHFASMAVDQFEFANEDVQPKGHGTAEVEEVEAKGV